MPRCFVIQPFDLGKFDKRYNDIFRPAIEAAGLESYRVDQDLATSIPIEDIEAGIRGAAICFADITMDNPNVWFELGFAIAERKPIVLVCSDERQTRFPFDVQHRTVTRYQTESLQDYSELSLRITARLKALLEKTSTLEAVAQTSPIRPVEGLEQQEIVALVSVAENLDTQDDRVSVHAVRQDMERSGFTRIAATLALRVLLEKGMVDTGEVQEWNTSYVGYGLTDKGFQWLLQNKGLLTLRSEPRASTAPPSYPTGPGDPEDDIPF
jgi:nucleoside 2-deoxyribosyltransferase